MGEPEQQPGGDAASLAHRSADRLAVALEEVGFDVGQAFPLLRGAVRRDGSPVVELGGVAPPVADLLSRVLTRAAAYGLTGTDPPGTGTNGAVGN